MSVIKVTEWSQCRKKRRPARKQAVWLWTVSLTAHRGGKTIETPDSSVSWLELPYVPKTIAKISPPHFPTTMDCSLKLWTQTKQTLPSLSCFCEIFFSEKRNNTNARLGWMGSDWAMTPSISDKLGETFKTMPEFSIKRNIWGDRRANYSGPIVIHFLHLLKVSCCAPNICILSLSQLKSKNHIQTKIKEFCTYIKEIYTNSECAERKIS